MNGAGSAFVCIGRWKKGVPSIHAMARDQMEKGMKISRRIMMLATAVALMSVASPAMADLKFGVAAAISASAAAAIINLREIFILFSFD